MSRIRVLFAIGLVLSLFCFSVAGAQEIRKNTRQESDNGPRIALADDAICTVALSGGSVRLTGSMRAAGIERGGLFIIQFPGEPGDDALNSLATQGVRLHGYLGDNAYWASVPAGTGLRQAKYLRAVARAQAADKIQPLVARMRERAKLGTKLHLTVALVPGTSRDDLAPLCSQLGVAPDQVKMLYNDRMTLDIPADRLTDLAASDLILAVEEGDPKRTVDSNAQTSSTIGATAARDYYGLDGTGVNIGIWDGGAVFKHKELKGRLTVVQKVDISDHATHVSGTMAASGKNASAKGMAPKARIYSYDFNGDVPGEMANAVVNYGIAVCNNSWGYVIGWSTDWDASIGYFRGWHGNALFGAYNTESAALDAVVRNRKLTIVFSAGNDRDDKNGVDQYWDWTRGDWYYSGSRYYEVDGPYMTVGPTGSAKNVITVGATQGKTTMASFSSWGPTKDGRIKPELTAPGVDIFSCIANNQYDIYSGTSMSAPAVTGSLALLVQQWRAYFGVTPSPAVLRALVIVTAIDINAAGPDYSYGFGVLNVAAASDFIYGNTQSTLMIEDTAKRGKTLSYQLTLPAGMKNAYICLAWIDPEGATLVNDLDLAVISPSGKKNQPWMLNPASPGAAAVRGVNTRDNIELVRITKPEAGDTWVITVKGSRFGSGKKQPFALALWGN